MNLEEFSTECGAYAQMQQDKLDALCAIGCQYDISRPDMRRLCGLSGVDWDDLQNHTGKPAAH